MSSTDHNPQYCTPASTFPIASGVSPTQAESLARHEIPGSLHPDEVSALCGLLVHLPSTPVPPPGPYLDDLHHHPEGDKDSGLQNCHRALEKYDGELCQAHREQIDTLLVFAGLFSAVVTAFSVESYQWLMEDPADASVELLRELVRIMSQNSNQTGINSSPAPLTNIPDAAVVRINVFWFLSLSLSLSAALIGILCKQWLREYERDAGQSSEMALAVRHVRFRGLEYWKVGTIVTSVPIVLQAALALFLIGIVDLLWLLHTAVATCVTVVAAVTMTFYLATTFLPLIQYAYICARCCGDPTRTGSYPALKAFTEPQCAYKSAQSWLALRMVQPAIEYCFRAYAVLFTFHDPPRYHTLVIRPASSWVTFDINWVKRHQHVSIRPGFAYESLSWIADNLGDTQTSAWIWHCLWACWLRNQDDTGDNEYAARDIECVARAYPPLEEISLAIPAPIRVQALLFQCSLRTEISINTAVELLLRAAPSLGAQSPWTLHALTALNLAYDSVSIRLDDASAMGLFRLAELYTYAILNGETPAYSGNYPYDASAFSEISALLDRGSGLRDELLPAMCSLALQWFRVQPFERSERIAKKTVSRMLSHYMRLGIPASRLHDVPGAIFPARSACAIAETLPEYRDYYKMYPSSSQKLLTRLLAIGSIPEPAACALSPAPYRTGDHAGSAPSPSGESTVQIQNAVETESNHATLPEAPVGTLISAL